MKFIVVDGNPVDGFTYHGTWDDGNEATDWASLESQNGDWWVSPLYEVPPVADEPTNGEFFICYVDGYDDPMPGVGPFPSRDAAMAAYRQSLVNAGAELDPAQTIEDMYAQDDAVRIMKVTQRP